MTKLQTTYFLKKEVVRFWFQAMSQISEITLEKLTHESGALFREQNKVSKCNHKTPSKKCLCSVLF